jgi:signal transduction histidine kinase
MDYINSNSCKPLVLIVDDSQSIQRYVRELLEEAGFRTFSATDGRTGLRCIESQNPDVVLLDIEMPVMNGLQVLDAVGKHKRLYSIILFTHLSDINNRIAGLDKGADDYITKPVEPDELMARVRVAARTTALKRELTEARRAAEDALDKYHETQKKLIQEQRLSAIAKLASGMAHEINNPLGFINSNIGTLKKYSNVLSEGMKRFLDMSDKFRDKDPELDKAVEETFNWIKKSKVALIREDIEPLITDTYEGIDRISSLLKCLLIMEKAVFYSGPESIYLNALVLSLNDPSMLRLLPGVSLTIEPSEAPIIIRGKNDQLQIAIENILQNAVDAAGEDGTIKVTTYSENDQACIEIQNSGEGIPQEVLPKIFEPFFTTRAIQKKIGLGLTISQYLIDANGGNIEVKSCPGEGTSVTITFSQEY